MARKGRRTVTITQTPVESRSVQDVIDSARRTVNAAPGFEARPEYFADPGPEPAIIGPEPEDVLDSVEPTDSPEVQAAAAKVAELRAAIARATGQAPPPTPVLKGGSKVVNAQAEVEERRKQYAAAKAAGKSDGGQFETALDRAKKELEERLKAVKTRLKVEKEVLEGSGEFVVISAAGPKPEPLRNVIALFTPKEIGTLVRWAKIAETSLRRIGEKEPRVDRMDDDSILSDEKLSWYLKMCEEWSKEAKT